MVELSLAICVIVVVTPFKVTLPAIVTAPFKLTSPAIATLLFILTSPAIAILLFILTSPETVNLFVVLIAPVKFAPVNSAKPWLFTNSVVATFVEFSLDSGVCASIYPAVAKFPFIEISFNTTKLPFTVAFAIVVEPVNVGDAIFAFRANADCVAVDTGLFASLVLSTLANPTIDFVIPFTVPVKVGESNDAYLFWSNIPFS